MKRGAAVLGLVLALLVAAVVVNALRFPSRQPPPLAVEVPAFSIDAASGRLAQAVGIPTVSPGGDRASPAAPFEAFRRFLDASYPLVRARIPREIVGGRSLLYRWEGKDPSREAILLLAHQDVVPAEGESGWSVPPFAGRIEGGYVWGRGAMDDKGPMVAILESAEALLAAGFEPSRTVFFAFGHDEEVGGVEGARAIAETLAARGTRLAFVLDEGLAVTEGILPGLKRPAALVGIAEKGAVNVELVARAEGGHASMPPRSTAAGSLARAMAALEEHPFPGGLRGPARALFVHLAPEMSTPHRLLFSNLWLFGPLVEKRLAAAPATDAVLRTTTAVVRLESGVKENMLPAEARGVVDLRISPGESVEGTVERVRRMAGPGVEVRALPGGWDPSPVSDPDRESFVLLTRVIRGAFPEAVVAPGLVLGATDSRHFGGIADAVYRFSPIRVGPKDVTRIHGVDERLAVANLEEMIRFYAALLRAAAG